MDDDGGSVDDDAADDAPAVKEEAPAWLELSGSGFEVPGCPWLLPGSSPAEDAWVAELAAVRLLAALVEDAAWDVAEPLEVTAKVVEVAGAVDDEACVETACVPLELSGSREEAVTIARDEPWPESFTTTYPELPVVTERGTHRPSSEQ